MESRSAEGARNGGSAAGAVAGASHWRDGGTAATASSTAAPTDSAGVAFDAHLYGETPAAHYVTEIDAETPLVSGAQQDGTTNSSAAAAGRGGAGAASGAGGAAGRGGGTNRSEDPARLAERERMLLATTDRGVLSVQDREAGVGVDKSIAAREDLYRRQRFQRALSPERADPFSDGTEKEANGGVGSGSEGGGAISGEGGARTYADVMLEQQLDREKQMAVRQIRKMQEEAELQRQLQQQQLKAAAAAAVSGGGVLTPGGEKKRRRWDSSTGGVEDSLDGRAQLTEAERLEIARAKARTAGGDRNAATAGVGKGATAGAGRGVADGGAVSAAAAALVSRWDTPLQGGGQTPGGAWGETPLVAAGGEQDAAATAAAGAAGVIPKKKSRWDATPTIGGTGQETPTPGQWGATPDLNQASTPMMMPGVGGGTPVVGSGGAGAGSVGSLTPLVGGAAGSQTPLIGGARKRSRWDATPVLVAGGSTDGDAAAAAAAGLLLTPGGAPSTPMTSGPGAGLTPGKDTGAMTNQLTPGITPLAVTGIAGATPLTPGTPLSTAEQLLQLRMQQELDERSRYLTDEELDCLLPKEGYEIVPPPADYNPPLSSAAAAARARQQAAASTPGVAATPTPVGITPLYTMPEEGGLSAAAAGFGGLAAAGGGGIGGQLTAEGGGVTMKAEDYQFFAKLFEDKDEGLMTQEEVKERKIQLLLLKIKNGTPPLRRSALRTLTEKAKEFGAAALFNQILPLMMQSTLEDQERHLLVKVIDRVLYRLDDAVRPYVHKILVVIEPLLIDEDYYARIEGREIISNLAKAAGLATMIATMRPDIDHPDEYVRNTTARAFAVVASALGIPSLILFLKAVCQSKKSWQARHTGIKIIQQMSILMGCGVLPHLKQLVEIIQHGLDDQVLKVKTVTALALAALAESAAPYGIEAFDSVLRPLWKGMGEMRGKGLAAYLKAIGSIIPLMDAYHANYYTREVMIMLVREFETNDEEMKKIVLRVVKQCVATEGVEGVYIRSDIVPPFFSKVWLVRNALDRRTAKLLIETVVEIANKAGGAHIIKHIVEDLKDPSEPFRKVTLEALEQIIVNNGVHDVDSRLEEQLVDGLLYAFQEQTSEDTTALLNGFSTIVNALGTRVKPYLPQVCGVIRWRLNTPSAKLRQQAADLIARIAVVMQKCGEEQMLGHLGLFLYEYLGEEYPEVLGSILGALKAIVNVIGMNKMTPPIKDLLPRLTPILKNRHEKVQENVIDLVGRIADRGGDLVSPKEWDRICFDLLDMLKASKKAIRRATVNTFGYIARTIGPQDVLATLLNNLKVQERQLRLCTTIAIAIVAETCLPYSVLPALMNEYRVPELNVQNGVLKTLSFMFEYIGEMAKDYIYTVVPLLEDALMDRDLVHRQTAAWATKHLALGVHGLSCEDALLHLLNYIWPNIFERSPHLVQAFFDAIDGMRVSLGPGIVFRYVLLGLFHPARKVREVYWRVYNNLYIGHQDAMVAFFPPIPDDDKGSYARDELLYVI